MSGALIQAKQLSWLLKSQSLKLFSVVMDKSTSTTQEYQNLDLHDISMKPHPSPRILPSQSIMDVAMNKYQLDKQTPIVLMDQRILLAGRAWFTLKYFGFKQVYVLDGGLNKWKQYKNTVEQNDNIVKLAECILCRYLENWNLNIINTADINKIVNNKDNQYQIIDSRDNASFNNGNIPGSINIPATDYLNPDMTFKDEQTIKQLLHDKGVDLNKQLISSCMTGKLATIPLLAMNTIYPNKNVLLYDGSYIEYSQQ